jgi:hypothetical protein
MKAPAMSLVALPAGIVHRQRNDGAEAEEHLAILIPAPAAGERLDHPVSI